jgi:hypothetical protein
MDADGDGEGMVYEGTVEVTAAEDVADIEIKITATGSHEVTVTAVDDAGNKMLLVTWVWHLLW